MSHSNYELLLLDRDLNALASLYPVGTGMIPPRFIHWSRSWRRTDRLDMRIHRTTPWLTDLSALGNFLEMKRNGEFEALFYINMFSLTSGLLEYEKDARDHANAVYVAGQGSGRDRNVVVRIDNNAIAEAGRRVEIFRDRRDISLEDLSALRDAGDAVLADKAILKSILLRPGEPETRDWLTICGCGVDVWLDRRIVLPPPGMVGDDGVVDISDADVDGGSISRPADEVMKGYVSRHLISPGDPNRTVANLVTQGETILFPSLVYQARFQSVLEVLQEIARRANAGFEIILNSQGQFEFRVLPQVDRTLDSSSPVVFYDTDVELDVASRSYRGHWDLGSKVSVVLEGFSNFRVDATIEEVTVELRPEEPITYKIGLDRPHTSEIDRFSNTLTQLAGTMATSRA